MKILGIGNAIVDVICKVEDDFKVSGKITDLYLNLLNKSEIKDLNFNFNFFNKNIDLKNISLNYLNLKILSENISLKKKNMGYQKYFLFLSKLKFF